MTLPEDPTQQETAESNVIFPKPVSMNVDVIVVDTDDPALKFLMFTFATHVGQAVYFMAVPDVEEIFLPDVIAALQKAKSGLIIPGNGSKIITPDDMQ